MNTSEKRTNTITRKKLRYIFDMFYLRNNKRNTLVIPKELAEFILEIDIDEKFINKECGFIYDNAIIIV